MTDHPAPARTVLVTGANRGLGLKYCRQLVAEGWLVLAATRDPERAHDLQALAREYPQRVRLVQLDVVKESDVQALAEELRGVPLDMLINNAGTFGPEGWPGGMRYQSLAHMDYEIWRNILEVNLLAPFRLTVALAPSLRLASRAVVVMLSSDLGSIGNNRLGQSHAYRTSKAGLNMLTRSIANEWPDLITIAMAPGWCKTELGGEGAQIDPADSVRAQVRTFAALNPSHNGQFIDRFGATVAW
ncbi:MAG: SDR family oxidoreductase [Gammaproteobacteria bacterium]|nr:SDR family oxidoreductase [Gammaproteobacteria bacterium]